MRRHQPPRLVSSFTATVYPPTERTRLKTAPTCQRHSMPVASFLEQFGPAYPQRDEGFPVWEDAFALMAENPYDNLLVERLMGELEKNGRFDVPVRVDFDDEDDHWAIADGMHRTVAWVRSGRKFIEFTEWSDVKTCLSDLWYETEFELSDLAGNELSEDAHMDFMDNALAQLSHELPTGEWATVALTSSSRGSTCITWDSITSLPGLEDYFSNKVADTVASIGLRAANVTSRVYVDSLDGEDD